MQFRLRRQSLHYRSQVEAAVLVPVCLRSFCEVFVQCQQKGQVKEAMELSSP